MDYIAMGRRIRELRKRAKMTQADLAKICGISTSFCGHIERGTRIASIETLVAIARKLNATTDYLLLGNMNMGSVGGENQTAKMRILNDIMRVLNTYADDWLRDS